MGRNLAYMSSLRFSAIAKLFDTQDFSFQSPHPNRKTL